MKKTFLVMMLAATSVKAQALAEQNIANPQFDDFYTVHESSSDGETTPFPSPHDMLSELFQSVNDASAELQVHIVSLIRFDKHQGPYGNPSEPYNRKKHFGSWVNDPRDETCHNTRAKVLIRDSLTPVDFNSSGCGVVSGKWTDPFGGRDYTRASDIQIDHFVPLKNAYISGGHKWNRVKRCLYANFLGNDYHLLAVYGKENATKSDRTPEGYMPPNPGYRCQYLVQWLKIKLAWSLGLTPPEKDTILQLAEDNRCDLNEFVMTAADLEGQRRFMAENTGLCQY